MDRLTMQELKKAAAAVASAYDLDARQAARVIGFYNSGDNISPQTIRGFLSGDLSAVPTACSALGIPLNNGPEKKPALDSKKNNHIKHNTDNSGPATDHGTNTTDCIQGGDGPQDTNNDIIPADIMGDGLPAGLVDDLKQCINDFCAQNNIDINHFHPQQWRACCMYIGQYIKNRGLLRDREKEKHNGGTVYNPYKLESLLYVWAFLCGVYHMVPLVHDFVSFCGVHRNYFYDYDGQGLTSTAVQIVKKARQIEENGLNTSVAGGGAGAVGGMFLLKTRHNYSETVNIQHTSTAAALGLSELPKLTENTI